MTDGELKYMVAARGNRFVLFVRNDFVANVVNRTSPYFYIKSFSDRQAAEESGKRLMKKLANEPPIEHITQEEFVTRCRALIGKQRYHRGELPKVDYTIDRNRYGKFTVSITNAALASDLVSQGTYYFTEAFDTQEDAVSYIEEAKQSVTHT